MNPLSKTTEIAFGLIAKAGEAKGYVFEALNAAKEGKFEDVEGLIAKADTLLTEAHQIQFKLLSEESSGVSEIEVNFIMVHAQDHLMSTLVIRDLTLELIKRDAKERTNESRV